MAVASAEPEVTPFPYPGINTTLPGNLLSIEAYTQISDANRACMRVVPTFMYLSSHLLSFYVFVYL